jgi:phosphatidylinositol alpha-mannosyltransferase
MICPYSLSVPGGVQGQVLGLTRALRSRGHYVRIIAPSDGPPPDGGVTVVGSSLQNPANGSVAPIAPDLSAQVRTIRTLWDEKFDVLHLHEPLVPGPTATAVVLKSAPMVGTFHAAGEQPGYKKLSGLARKFADRLDVKVAVSRSARRLAETAIPGPWRVLFNGVELAPFRNATPWEPRRTGPDGEPVPAVLFVGRHEERKGLRVMLEALALVDRDLDIWVAGDGPESEELQARFAGDARIEWLGRVGDEERNERLAAASVFCVPSLGGESFGVILLEGMAAGVPVVASSIEGYAAVAGPRNGGPAAAELVEPGNVEAFAAAIRTLLDDPRHADALRDAGSARAEEFSMNHLAEIYEEIYESIALKVGT